MKTDQLSTCFCTTNIEECKDYYQRYFGVEIIFDSEWYVNLRIGKSDATIQFIQPQGDIQEFGGKGVILNFKVDDVDSEYDRLMVAGLVSAMPLEDHLWGDRGFSVIDPIGNSVYIYSDREPSEEYRKYYVD